MKKISREVFQDAIERGIASAPVPEYANVALRQIGREATNSATLSNMCPIAQIGELPLTTLWHECFVATFDNIIDPILREQDNGHVRGFEFEVTDA